MEKRQREFLSEEELENIEKLKICSERIEIVRDLFPLSCYTWISNVRIVQLKSKKPGLPYGET